MAVLCTVTVNGTLNNQQMHWSTNFQFGATSALTSAQCITLANDIMTSFGESAPIKAMIDEARSYTGVRVAFRDPDTGPETASGDSSVAPVAGTATIGFPPPQVATVVTLRTGIPGRSFRGRLYIPTLTNTDDGSVPAIDKPVYNAGVQGIAQAISARATLAGTNLAWGVWSRTKHVLTPINEVSVGSRVDTQRRRNVGEDTYTDFPVT